MKIKHLVTVLALLGTLSYAMPTIAAPAHPTVPAGLALPVLAYHDVVLANSDKDEPDTISVDSLVRQFAWLQAKGYTAVSLEAAIAASQGKTVLPAKAILLTFDDGYKSFHTHVLPLLRAYNWPATLALIGNRVEAAGTAHPGEPEYLSPSELQDLVASGLVQFANHSYDLHHGVKSNAWGNTLPAAVTRTWTTDSTESESQWTARVEADLKRNQDVIFKLTGQHPKAMVWPYGRYNAKLQTIAARLGLTLLFTLEDGVSNIRTEAPALRRHLVGRSDQESAVSSVVENQWAMPPTVRATIVKVQDLQPGAGPETALSALLPKLAALQGNVVLLDPLVREKGVVTGAMFPTAELAVTSAYANRVAAAVTGRAGYNVWLSLPLSPTKYPGLTQAQVLQLVEDAAQAVPVSGLVVEDAEAVPPTIVAEARKRVALWRSTPTLAVSFNGPVSPDSLSATVMTAGARYVLRTAGADQAIPSSVPVIALFDADDLAGARKQAQQGWSNMAIRTVPADAGKWIEFFSLRSTPQRRIGIPVQ